MLTTADNRALYWYAQDTPGVSNCTGGCESYFPPFGFGRGDAVTFTLPAGVPGTLSTITRSDGTTQLAYDQMPLYLDALGVHSSPGNTRAQGQGNTWWVVTPTAGRLTVPIVQVRTDPRWGPVLTTVDNRTLYWYTKDTPGVSNCTNGCDAYFPPFGFGRGDAVTFTLPAGVPGTLSTITRSDGTTQLAYDQMPLYFYAFGLHGSPGNTLAQGAENTWWVVTPTAGRLTAPGATPQAASAAQPTTAAATPKPAAKSAPAAAPSTTHTNGCVLTPAPKVPASVGVNMSPPPQIMLADVTDTCPLSSYHAWETLTSGEYDGSKLAYVRSDLTLIKAPQMTEEVMVLLPSSAAWYESTKPGGGLFADGMLNAGQAEHTLLLHLPPDPNPPYAHWTEGLTKAETAALQAATPTGPPTPTDACGSTAENDASGYRIVPVTATCTEATFPRVAEKGVPSYSIGGTQFASTATNDWLLAATAKRDDGNGEVLVLIPVAAPDCDCPQVQSVRAPADDRDMQAVRETLHGGTVPASLAPTVTAGHDFYVTWIEGGAPTP